MMNNLHKLFLKFNERITLTQTRSDELKVSRENLQDVIIKWFKENQPDHLPSFALQGSFAMKTTLNQLNEKEYDIDLGVYVSGYENASPSSFPNPQLFHSWLNKATNNETDANNKDKYTCIRVTYKSGYHVDLPSYIKTSTGIVYLANTNLGWVKSDPLGFTNWFKQSVANNGEQVRRVVKYIKAWKDYNSIPLSGVSITILTVRNFCRHDSHDENALCDTLVNINKSLDSFFICKKPVEGYEDLFLDFDENKKTKIKESLKDFQIKMQKILSEADVDVKKKLFNKLFGDRFVFSLDEEFEKTDKPGILKSDGRSA